MNELNKRLYNNYINEIKEYLTFLRSKGYVLIRDYGTTNIRINKYLAEKNSFTPVYQLFEFPNVILEKVPNYYDLDVGNAIQNLIEEVIPELSHEDLKEHGIYLNAAEKYEDEKKLNNELKELKKLNKNEITKIDKSLFESPHVQAALLKKEFIIYCDSKTMARGYYQFDKKRFMKLDEEDIINILEKGFKVKNVFSRIKIMSAMRNIYLDELIKSDIPIRWNENIRNKNLMNSNESGYKRIKEVTDQFI